MQNRLTIGAQLAKHSIAIIKQKKSLLIFPIIGSLMVFILFCIAFLPLAKIEVNTWETHHIAVSTFFIFIAILLLFFSVVHLITQLCRGALCACAIKHLKGEPYTINTGFKAIFARLSVFYLWVMVMTTFGIGVILCQYWMDNWHTKKIATHLLAGLSWIIATYFVIPVLIVENLGPIDAIKRSAHLIKTHWGSPLILRTGTTALFFALELATLIPFIVATFMGGKTNIMIGTIITVFLFLCVSIFNTASRVITSCALYLFATGVSTHCFDSELLKKAFHPTKNRIKR